MNYISNSAEETHAIAAKLAAGLVPGDIIAFHGDLGAGKTAFSSGLIAALGYDGRVTSPTFALVNEYETTLGRVCHFDLYRLMGEEALYDMGFEEYLDGKSILLIEWSQRATALLPRPYYLVTMCHGEQEDSRHISIKTITKDSPL